MKKIKCILEVVIISTALILSSCSIGTIGNLINNKVDDITGVKECDKMMYSGLEHKNLEVVKEAIQNGANINATAGKEDNGTSNPIRIALFLNDRNIVTYLIDHGANVNYMDNTGVSLLMYCAYSGDVSTCNLLIKHGVKVNATSKSKVTDAAVNDIHHDGYTALDYAVLGDMNKETSRELNDTVTLLLNSGAKITTQTLIATMTGDDKAGYCRYALVQKILKSLISSGGQSGLDTAMEAAILGNTSKVEELVNEGKYDQDEKVQILLNVSAFGSADELKLLVSKGFDLNITDQMDNTPLMAAAENGNLDTVKYLITNGVNIESQNINHDTALLLASRNSQNDVTEYLVAQGASI
jgi:ankyrin repeat protein